MLSSTREIAPSCIENVEELIERQEKALAQLETKRAIVKDLIAKGRTLLENPEYLRYAGDQTKICLLIFILIFQQAQVP